MEMSTKAARSYRLHLQDKREGYKESVSVRGILTFCSYPLLLLLLLLDLKMLTLRSIWDNECILAYVTSLPTHRKLNGYLTEVR